MIRFVLIVVTLLFTLSVFAQQSPSPSPNQFDKDYYLRLSRQQKTLGTVSLVVGGVTASVGGFIWFMAPIAGLSETGDVKGAERTGRNMVIIGGALAGASIPLFIASKKNKQKAALYTGTSSIQVPLKGDVGQLAVGLRIPL